MTIQPQGEAVRKAIKYISEEKLATPDASLQMLIRNACMKFDLTPKDAMFLEEFYREKNT
jgi:hypothetical protein